jgi:hypothetical protein
MEALWQASNIQGLQPRTDIHRNKAELQSLGKAVCSVMGIAYNTRIVTNGLILCLDAANRKSYPGSGTTWFDLSTNSLAGNFVNGVAFDSANGGSIAFDGANEVVTFPMSALRPTNQITQECWFSISQNQFQVFIGAQRGSSADNSYVLWLNGANVLAAGINPGGPEGSINLNYQTINFTLSTNRYYHFVHTYNGSTQQIYMNGESVFSWATTGSLVYDNLNTLLAIGNDWGSGYDQGLNSGCRGNLPIVRIYNRALTVSEIRQNFNGVRRRFGI